MKEKSTQRKVPVIVQVLIWIVAVLCLLAVSALALVNYAISPVSKPGEGHSVEIKVPSGMSVKELSEILEEEELIHSAMAFYAAARFNAFDRNAAFNLKSGVYTVNSEFSLKEIYFLVQSGVAENLTVHIPEGLTITKIAKILEENGVCSQGDFIDCCYSREMTAEYGIPADNMEGYLFPDTYYLMAQMPAEKVVRIMADNFFERLATVDNTASLTPEQLFEKITMASIVEREYKVASEAPIIASVFWNRINSRDGLYSCATIEYIITEIQKKPHPERITYADLEIDSPYNTYRWRGLTPGPISNPGLVAIDASINTPETDYYYFVLTDPDAGSHTFSKTFDEHKAANNLNLTRK